VDRRTRNLFALVLVVVVAATGGAALLLSDTTMLDPDGPPDTTRVEGVIVAVDGSSLANIRGFTLRQKGGETLDLQLGELENGAVFPPGHLAEHQATAQPVVVYYRMEGNERFAVRIDDAAN
jgi:hypothetical protein